MFGSCRTACRWWWGVTWSNESESFRERRYSASMNEWDFAGWLTRKCLTPTNLSPILRSQVFYLQSVVARGFKRELTERRGRNQLICSLLEYKVTVLSVQLWATSSDVTCQEEDVTPPFWKLYCAVICCQLNISCQTINWYFFWLFVEMSQFIASAVLINSQTSF